MQRIKVFLITFLCAPNILFAASNGGIFALNASAPATLQTQKKEAAAKTQPPPPQCPVIYYPGAFVGSKTTLFLSLPPSSSMAQVLAALTEQEPALKMHALYKIINLNQFDPRPISCFNDVNIHYGMIALTQVEHRAHKEQWFVENLYINTSFYGQAGKAPQLPK